MLHGSSVQDPHADTDEYLSHPDFHGLAAKSQNPREQLRQLKIKHGSWALAPRLITVESMFKRQLIFELGSPSWLYNSSRAKNVLSPVQVAEPLATWNVSFEIYNTQYFCGWLWQNVKCFVYICFPAAGSWCGTRIGIASNQLVLGRMRSTTFW